MWLVLAPSESSLSAPASADSTSASIEQSRALALSCTWRGKPSPSHFWQKKWRTAHWLRLLSGVTSPPSTAARGVASWIASLGAPPAKTSPLPGSERDSMASAAASSGTSSGWCVRPSRLSSSGKTSAGQQVLSLGCLPLSGLKATGVRGSGFELLTLERRTSAPESSSWPTATAERAGNNRGGGSGRVGPVRPSLDSLEKGWSTPRSSEARRGMESQSKRDSRGAGGPSLADQAKGWPTATVGDSRQSGRHTTTTGVMHPGTSLTDAIRDRWPTPLALDAEKDPKKHRSDNPSLPALAKSQWSTPRASDGEKSGPNARDGNGTPHIANQAAKWATPTVTASTGGNQMRGGDRQNELLLAGQASLASGPPVPVPIGAPSKPPSLRLNPEFVEWLMGMPRGWTALGPIAFAVSETESSQPRRPRRPRSSGSNSTSEVA
jgi:hypothetical protein